MQSNTSFSLALLYFISLNYIFLGEFLTVFIILLLTNNVKWIRSANTSCLCQLITSNINTNPTNFLFCPFQNISFSSLIIFRFLDFFKDVENKKCNENNWNNVRAYIEPLTQFLPLSVDLWLPVAHFNTGYIEMTLSMSWNWTFLHFEYFLYSFVEFKMIIHLKFNW